MIEICNAMAHGGRPVPDQGPDRLDRIAREIRATCVQMAFDGREGHLSSSLSMVDILVALFWEWLAVFPEEPRREDRDRFLLSKGHGCASLYAVLAHRGFFPVQALGAYNQPGSPLPNHPCVHALPMLESSSGSLGHGLGIATGMAYGLRLKGSPARVVALLGDGECNEGSVWESANFAAAQGLERVVAIVDNNGIQAVGRNDELSGHTSLEEKFRSFGWGAVTVDVDSPRALLAAMAGFPLVPGRPSAFVARTRMGVSFMERDVLWHYRKPSAEDLRNALDELGARPIQKGAAS